MNGNLLIASFVALVLGSVIGFFVKNYQIVRETGKKQNKANKVLVEAERKSTELVKEAQDRAIEIAQSAEKDALTRRTEITRFEERLQSRSDQLDRRAEKLEDREHAISQRQSSLDKKANKVEELHMEVSQELEKVSQLTQAEAKDILLERVEQEATDGGYRLIDVEPPNAGQMEEIARKLKEFGFEVKIGG